MLLGIAVERTYAYFGWFLSSSHILEVPVRPSEPEVNEKTALDHK